MCVWGRGGGEWHRGTGCTSIVHLKACMHAPIFVASGLESALLPSNSSSESANSNADAIVGMY